MILKQGEIILLKYPFTDLEGSKVRPALIISQDKFNKKGNDVIAIPLTTIIKEEPYSILITQNDLTNGKLIKPSRIRIDKIFTVDKNLILMKIGKINSKILNKIKKEIYKII